MNTATAIAPIPHDLLDQLTATHPVQFWGREYEITPVLLPEVFGDGQRIIGLAPLNTRPNFYIIRLDSSMADLTSAAFYDFLDTIYEALEDAFGTYEHHIEDGGDPFSFPVPNLSCGSTWWPIFPEDNALWTQAY